ncbi:MAG TPA: DUF4282 domain-containing protein [Thermoanaerobaculia bacterium]|nr:DUF4282 domain-containing protein [Thermoanaerobaculia bacterium]HUM30600.1 DUF4282 domain-containing protein [Thermoanaerobaculia bacterium]HXK68872.1 DUF4282 domain-containing protein [Thermoanaerobaculia bacterium]
MSDQAWFVSVNGAAMEGQHTAEEVTSIINGNPAASILVWKEGMAAWAPPSDVPEFAGAVSAPPPPPRQAPTPPGPAIRHPRPQQGGHALAEQAGVFKSLFDFKFDNFITPKIISIIYGICMVLIGLGFLFMIYNAFKGIINGIRWDTMKVTFMGFFMLILSPILTLIYLAFTRMFFEVVIVLFKIKENTSIMADASKK